MESTNNISTVFQFEKNVLYRVNVALALLFALIFFTGTLLSFYNIPSEKLLSEGNIIVLFLVLFVSGIFLSWYYEKLSGILLLIIGTASFIYLLFHLDNWMFHLMPLVSIMGAGLFLVIKQYREGRRNG